MPYTKTRNPAGRPIQAGDYGKHTAPANANADSASKPEDKGQPDTDGKKTLALWSH